MHMSQFAGELRCQHCYKTHATQDWPQRGDSVPFYFQKEPGNYQVKVECPHCGKEWYVVWDENPGPISRLDL